MSNRSGSKGYNTRNPASKKSSGKKASSHSGSSSKKSGSATSHKMAHSTSFPGTKPKDHGDPQDGHFLEMPLLDTSDPGFLLDLPYRGHEAMFPMDVSSPELICSMNAMDPVHAFSPPATECGQGYIPAESGPTSPVSMYPRDALDFPSGAPFNQNVFLDGFAANNQGPYGSITQQPGEDSFQTSGVSRAPCFDEVTAPAMSHTESAMSYSDSPLDWRHEDSMTSKNNFAARSSAMPVQSPQLDHSPMSRGPRLQSMVHTSGPAMDDMDWHASLDTVDNDGLTPPALADGLCLPPASYPMDASTMRSSYTVLKHPFNSSDLCSPFQNHAQGPAGVMPPFAYHPTSRRTSDGESTAKARKDPLYKALPGKDGLYHCPHEKTGCKHAPEKLKCNYDKHLDSHLKPYSCKYEKCNSLSFSSTACLLRHEREAHGLHGHGNNPFACLFPGCERAQPEKGFPRSWNLKDHMKRVHGYTVQDVPPRNYLTPPNSPDSLGPQLRSQGLDASRSAGTKKSKGKTTSKPTKKRTSASVSGFQEELKAEIDRLGPRELEHLRRCREQGMDFFRDVCKREVY